MISLFKGTSKYKSKQKQLFIVLTLEIALVGSSLLSTNAFAAAFQSYEFGTPTLGRAAVGQSVVKDASASFLNPASMSQLECSEMMLGSELVITKNRFRPHYGNTFTGNDGGNAGMLFPGVGLFSVFSAAPDLKLGLSLATPFAGTLDYNNGWVGRYFVQSTYLMTLDLNPSFSYAINEWFSIGGGAILEYAKLNQTSGIPAVPAIRRGEGQSDLRLENYAPGFTLGVLWTPCYDTQLGISYRSQVHHKLKGNTTFLNLDTDPETSSVLKLPQGIIASLSHDVNDCLTVISEIGWTNWRVFKSTIIEIDDITLTIPRHWKDTYRVGAGFQQKINPELLWQLGISYDTSPTKAHIRLPDLPMDRQWRAGTGFIINTYEMVSLGINYEYLNLGKGSIYRKTRLGTLSGHYPKNFGHFFGLSVNFKL